MSSRYQQRARPSHLTPAEKVAEEARRKKALEAWGTPQPSTFYRNNTTTASQTSQPSQPQPGRHALHDVENSKTPGHNPNSAHFSKKFPCSYKGCGRRFNERKHLIQHKTEEHDYCKVCNEDYEDEDALHMHKMQSERHVVCNICGIEFQSEPGRDRHAKQMHAAQQNIECRGCHKVFAKGSGLLLHFEQNACKPLQSLYIAGHNIHGKDMLESNRTMVAMRMEQLQEEAKAKKLAARGSSVAASVVSESEGGVALNQQPSIMDDLPTEPDFGTTGDGGQYQEFENLIQMAASDRLQEPLVPKSAKALSETGSAASGDTEKAWTRNYPVLKPHVKGQPGQPEDLTTSMDTLSLAGSTKSSVWGGNASKKLYPNATPTPVPADVNLEGLKGIKVGEDAAEAQLEGPGIVMTVDPMTDRFKCQFPTCDETFDDTWKMIEHMQTHKGATNRCSSCFKIFKSASALVAHMESASLRCNIRATRGYGNAMHLVSGGFLGAYGMMEDGAVKLDSQKKPETFW